MKKLILIVAVLLSFSGTAHAQTTTADCQQYWGTNFYYDPSSNSCKKEGYQPSTSGQGGTNYNCPNGQTYSSTGNNGAGGCVTDPSITNPATPDYNCPNGQTYSSTGNYGTGGCVADPSASASADTTGSGGSGSGGSGGGSGSAYTTATTQPTAASGNGQLTYTPLEPLPGDNNNNGTYNSLSSYLTLMFNILLSIGAMIAVVTLVLAGITYMVSEVVDKKSAARRRINAAFVGLGLLLTSWLILYTINPNLVKLCILNLDQQCGGNVTTGAGGGAVTPNSPNPTPAPSVLAAQEASCKNKPGGDLCAFDPTPGQPGTFQCDCYQTGAL